MFVRQALPPPPAHCAAAHLYPLSPFSLMITYLHHSERPRPAVDISVYNTIFRLREPSHLYLPHLLHCRDVCPVRVSNPLLSGLPHCSMGVRARHFWSALAGFPAGWLFVPHLRPCTAGDRARRRSRPRAQVRARLPHQSFPSVALSALSPLPPLPPFVSMIKPNDSCTTIGAGGPRPRPRASGVPSLTHINPGVKPPCTRDTHSCPRAHSTPARASIARAPNSS